MSKAPCKDCPDRELGCHSHCEKYIEYAAEHKRLQELKAKQRQTSDDYFGARKYHVRKDTRK